MSATDELRRMLDERGVEWRAPNSCQRDDVTTFTAEGDFGGMAWELFEMGDGTFQASAEVYDELTPEQAIAATLGGEINGDTSDGYHTFNELYHHRAVLFSVIVENYRDAAWKARKHHDGTMYGGMFIVGIDTPWGQASYHYDLDPYWDMFDCEELEAAPEWDGHTPDDAIERIGKLATLGGVRAERTCSMEYSEDWSGDELYPTVAYQCSVCGHITQEGLPDYCPRCGAKVVESDEA